MSEIERRTESIVIPVVEESLQIDKREVETGRVRIHKEVIEEEGLVSVPIRERTCRVDRVPVNQMVSEIPQPWQEGDTFIIPVVEETWVLEKRLIPRTALLV